MANHESMILNAILRSDQEAFLARCMCTLNPGHSMIRNWHIDAILYHLECVRLGKIKRLIINLPPRSLKSIMVSVAFPAFALGHNPRLKIFCISYSTELADKFALDARSIMQAAWYQRAFPRLARLRVADSDIFTEQRGFRKSTSINATLTGLGGDIFIIDDPLKAQDAQSEAVRTRVNEWFSNTLVSRLDDKVNGAIIVVMQRVHLHDLTGHLLERSSEWTLLDLPAIAEDEAQIATGHDKYHFRQIGDILHPEREPLDVLERLRGELGIELFSAQYQQRPVPPGGSIIREEWLKYYEEQPDPDWPSRIIQSWDTASKDGIMNDWSVCTTWLIREKNYYLLDMTRGRYDYPTLRNIAIDLAKRFKPSFILVEDASTGIALAQELRLEGVAAIKPIKPNGDKLARLYIEQIKFEKGNVHFPKNAHFLTTLKTELLTFPQSRHDDIVDSLTQALAYKFGYDSTLSWV